ncbi:MAG: Crp/Fnr family transcriptional regulator [Candidatus Neomarinimicrobiota bacterium]
MNTSDIELLRSVPLFIDLSMAVLQELLDRMSKRFYRKNNMILMQDEMGDTFFTISKGSVKINRLSADGREVVFAILGEGEFFGEMSLLDEETRSANAVALEDSEVLILKRGDFLAFLEKYPRVSISLLAEMAGRIRKIDAQIEGLSLSDAAHRIGMTLLRLSEELGVIQKGVIEVNGLPYLKDIANMAGTSRETVSRTMKLFEREGMIQRRGRRLKIFDYSQFKRTFG